MPEKKKQHFVPKLYLRNFSIKPNLKTINLFNVHSCKLIRQASLKHQCYKDYFYGRDSELENSFEKIEQRSVRVLRQMTETKTLPRQDSDDYQMFLVFVSTLVSRTVYAAQSSQELAKKHNHALHSLQNVKVEPPALMPEVNLKDGVRSALAAGIGAFSSLLELSARLLINKTDEPFMTSDNPVVLYNQFLESRKTYGSNTGFEVKGIEVLFPLSPDFAFILFDEGAYKSTPKHKTVIEVTREDVISMNLLQWISANENVYVGNSFSEESIQEYKSEAEKYRRESKVNVELYGEVEKGEVLLHQYRTDIRCNLDLSFMKIRKKARKYDLGDKVFHAREEDISRMQERLRYPVKGWRLNSNNNSAK
jgi:hypothetical protein